MLRDAENSFVSLGSPRGTAGLTGFKINRSFQSAPVFESALSFLTAELMEYTPLLTKAPRSTWKDLGRVCLYIALFCIYLSLTLLPLASRWCSKAFLWVLPTASPQQTQLLIFVISDYLQSILQEFFPPLFDYASFLALYDRDSDCRAEIKLIRKSDSLHALLQSFVFKILSILVTIISVLETMGASSWQAAMAVLSLLVLGGIQIYICLPVATAMQSHKLTRDEAVYKSIDSMDEFLNANSVLESGSIRSRIRIRPDIQLLILNGDVCEAAGNWFSSCLSSVFFYGLEWVRGIYLSDLAVSPTSCSPYTKQ
jgi:hypothetical protein